MGILDLNKLFIISRYREDFSWIYEYTKNYLIYNKGEPIYNDFRVFNTENIGGNQRDIFHYIYNHYEELPDAMVFVQAYPFDHCRKDIFDKLILNNTFTSLEYYGPTPSNGAESRTTDGGFLEIDDNWYISSHNRSYQQSCKYSSLSQFMNTYFSDYESPGWIRFAPGSQYIITKEIALHYSKNFWYRLMNELNTNNSTEAHVIERSLWMIFQCVLKEK